MIAGTHVIVYSRNADADRALFRDVFRLRSVDAGGGWLIFALPPAELAFHPGKNDEHELYLMCLDLPSTIRELGAHGVECAKPRKQPWGILTSFRLPGGGRLGLYQPTHRTAARLTAKRRAGAEGRSTRGRRSSTRRSLRSRR